MSAITKSVTRQELYEAVWRTPITKLALEWGVSNTSIVSACNKMNVPRPATGHWSSVHRGWQMESDPLPPPVAGDATSAILKSATSRHNAVRVKDVVGASEPNFPVVTMAETFDQTRVGASQVYPAALRSLSESSLDPNALHTAVWNNSKEYGLVRKLTFKSFPTQPFAYASQPLTEKLPDITRMG